MYELEQLEQEIKDKITKYFQDRIKATLEQMEGGTKKLEKNIRELQVKIKEKGQEKS